MGRVFAIGFGVFLSVTANAQDLVWQNGQLLVDGEPVRGAGVEFRGGIESGTIQNQNGALVIDTVIRNGFDNLDFRFTIGEVEPQSGKVRLLQDVAATTTTRGITFQSQSSDALPGAGAIESELRQIKPGATSEIRDLLVRAIGDKRVDAFLKTLAPRLQSDLAPEATVIRREVVAQLGAYDFQALTDDKGSLRSETALKLLRYVTDREMRTGLDLATQEKMVQLMIAFLQPKDNSGLNRRESRVVIEALKTLNSNPDIMVKVAAITANLGENSFRRVADAIKGAEADYRKNQGYLSTEGVVNTYNLEKFFKATGSDALLCDSVATAISG